MRTYGLEWHDGSLEDSSHPNTGRRPELHAESLAPSVRRKVSEGSVAIPASAVRTPGKGSTNSYLRLIDRRPDDRKFDIEMDRWTDR